MRHGIAAALGVLALVATATVAPAAMADTEVPGPRVVTEDGTSQDIDAIDPSNRTAGMTALYTPEFGTTTGTNAFGAEAVLEPVDEADEDDDRYVVTSVCDVWSAADGDCDAPGDNEIPTAGFVLSASPPGADGDDPRVFIAGLDEGDVVTVELPALREATTTLDATDPTPETNPGGVDDNGECFPGCRGGEQLIRYTSAFGERTGTNQFGFEVIVTDGRVVQRGGNDNAIPSNGEVLSGHGSRGEWLATNAPAGAKVDVDGDELTVTVDVTAYLLAAEWAVDRADDALVAAGDACLAIDGQTATDQLTAAVAWLAEARAAEEDGDEAAAVAFAEDAERAADRSWQATRTSRTFETRGVWVRPEEETPADIADTVADLADAGFTTIYLETFFQGYTIFPSQVADDYGIEPQRPQFSGFDPLAVWVAEAAEHGLELHSWVHTFFVGNDALGGEGPILEEYPEWAAVERGAVDADGPRPSTAEAGYYFLDPSIPEARAYLHAVFDEISSEYEVDGLHLDYIRYPISLPVEVSFSYSDHARAAFQAQAGVDPLELDTDDEEWEDWNDWRREQVTSFVAERHERSTQHDRDLVLSAAVFPDRFDAEDRKLQDWSGWSHAGTIDTLAGMSFGGSPSQSAQDTRTMLDATSEQTLIVTGTYAPFSSLPTDTMLEQIDAVRGAGAHGVALFAYNQLTDRQAEALGRGAFREPAVSTDRGLVTSTLAGLGDLRHRLDGVHAGCLDRGTQRVMTARIDQAIRSLERADTGHGNPDGALRQAERNLRRLADWVERRVDPELLADQLAEEATRAADVVAAARSR